MTVKRFLLNWAGYVLISNLETNPLKQNSKVDFSRRREKSVVNR